MNIENRNISAYHKIVERIFLDGEKQKKFSKILGINKPRLKKLVFKLLINGWYFDDWTEVDGRTIKFLQNHLEGGSLTKINDFFIQHYEQSLGLIKERLGKRYPKRRDLFQEGFEAIEEKRYSSATLIFLTQIDGISYDTTQKFYFTSLNKSKNFVPQISLTLKKI